MTDTIKAVAEAVYRVTKHCCDEKEARYITKVAVEAYEKAKEKEFSEIDEKMLNKAIATYDPSLTTSVGEAMQIREITVGDVAEKLLGEINEQIAFTKFYFGFAFRPNKHYVEASAIGAAKALAKLGCIRIVGEV